MRWVDCCTDSVEFEQILGGSGGQGGTACGSPGDRRDWTQGSNGTRGLKWARESAFHHLSRSCWYCWSTDRSSRTTGLDVQQCTLALRVLGQDGQGREWEFAETTRQGLVEPGHRP